MAEHAEYPLDHFEFYLVRSDEHQPVGIELKGQFDRGSMPGRVHARRYFAPATDKNGEGIRDEDAHLTWYDLESSEREPDRTVVIANQFGDQKYRIGPPRALLVPAQKKGHDRPGRVGHFKVYPVNYGDFEPREVRLANQFEEKHHTVEVERPVAFAVPVEKRGKGHEGPIVDRESHLTIYGISPHSYREVVGARDQFGSYRMQLYRSYFLAVPTTKREWGE